MRRRPGAAEGPEASTRPLEAATGANRAAEPLRRRPRKEPRADREQRRARRGRSARGAPRALDPLSEPAQARLLDAVELRERRVEVLAARLRLRAEDGDRAFAGGDLRPEERDALVALADDRVQPPDLPRARGDGFVRRRRTSRVGGVRRCRGSRPRHGLDPLAEGRVARLPGVGASHLAPAAGKVLPRLGQRPLERRTEVLGAVVEDDEIAERLELGQPPRDDRLSGREVLVQLHRIGRLGERRPPERDRAHVEARGPARELAVGRPRRADARSVGSRGRRAPPARYLACRPRARTTTTGGARRRSRRPPRRTTKRSRRSSRSPAAGAPRAGSTRGEAAPRTAPRRRRSGGASRRAWRIGSVRGVARTSPGRGRRRRSGGARPPRSRDRGCRSPSARPGSRRRAASRDGRAGAARAAPRRGTGRRARRRRSPPPRRPARAPLPPGAASRRRAGRSRCRARPRRGERRRRRRGRAVETRGSRSSPRNDVRR